MVNKGVLCGPRLVTSSVSEVYMESHMASMMMMMMMMVVVVVVGIVGIFSGQLLKVGLMEVCPGDLGLY